MLLSAGGPGIFTEPERWLNLAPIANAGALLGQNYPNGVQLNGVTYWGYNDGDNGNIDVRTYDHATGFRSVAKVVEAGLEIETHDPPSLLMRDSDHKLMVFYTKHSGSVAYLRTATIAESITTFGARVSLHTSIGASDYTYPSVHQLAGVTGQPIYLFFRDGNTAGTPGTQAWCTYSVSTDNGATWSAKAYVHKPTNKRPYWMVRTNGVDRMDLFLCQDARQAVDNVPAAHAYFTGGSWFTTSSGALTPPFAYSAMTEVYDGSAGSADPMDIAYQSNGDPVVAWRLWKPPTPTGGTDAYWARWTGSAWDAHLIQADADEVVILTVDPVAMVLTRRLVAGKYEIWRYRSTDRGTTWSGSPVFTGTSDDLEYLSGIRDYGPGLVALWAEGTYVSATDFDFGVFGVTA